jgi:hypothetical protein
MTRSSAAALLSLLALAPLAHADTRVYRCEDAGRVTYSDFPCANARALSIDAGAAAPDARERLRRDQDALDQRAAARRDALAREETLRMQVARAPEPGPSEPPPDYNPVYDFAYPPLGTFAGAPGRDHVRHRDDRRDREREKKRRVITQPPPTPLRGR